MAASTPRIEGLRVAHVPASVSSALGDVQVLPHLYEHTKGPVIKMGLVQTWRHKKRVRLRSLQRGFLTAGGIPMPVNVSHRGSLFPFIFVDAAPYIDTCLELFFPPAGKELCLSRPAFHPPPPPPTPPRGAGEGEGEGKGSGREGEAPALRLHHGPTPTSDVTMPFPWKG